MNKLFLVAFLSVWFISGCTLIGSPNRSNFIQDNQKLQQQVFNVERAFASTMAERNHEAFKSFLSSEVVFISGNTQRGKESVAKQWKRFFEEEKAPFSWQPETVEVLDSGELAISTGPVHSADGKLISIYTSIWRQESPGEWKIILDKGNKACE